MIPGFPNPLDLIRIPFNIAGSVATKAAKEIFEMIANLLLSGIGWLFAIVWDFIDSTTTPDLYATWFAGGPFAIVVKLASMLLMLALALAIAEAIWNRDGTELARAVVQHFPKALFMLTGLLFVTTLGLALADAVTVWMLDTVAYGANDFAESLLDVDNSFTFGLGLVVIMIAALVMIFVLLIVALELIVRESFIFVLVAITALALVADVYRPARGAGGRAGRLLAGVIAMKPIVALCFAIGAAALGSAGGSGDDGVSAIPEPGEEQEAGEDLIDASDQNTLGVVLAGLATISLAAITPFTVLRLFPWEGTEATEGTRGQVSGAVTGPAKAAAMMAASGGASAGAASAGGGAAAGQAAGSGGAAAASAAAATSRAN